MLTKAYIKQIIDLIVTHIELFQLLESLDSLDVSQFAPS